MKARCVLLLAFVALPRIATAAPPGIEVEITTDRPSVVLQRTDVDQTVCVAPCNRWLTRDALYRISGEGVHATSPFRLPDEGKRVALIVQAGSSWRYSTGWALTGAAGATLSTAAVILFATSWGATDANTPQANADIARWKPRGEALLAGGVALAAAGLYLLVTSQTHVRFHAESSPGAPEAPSARPPSP